MNVDEFLAQADDVLADWYGSDDSARWSPATERDESDPGPLDYYMDDRATDGRGQWQGIGWVDGDLPAPAFDRALWVEQVARAFDVPVRLLQPSPLDPQPVTPDQARAAVVGYSERYGSTYQNFQQYRQAYWTRPMQAVDDAVNSLYANYGACFRHNRAREIRIASEPLSLHADGHFAAHDTIRVMARLTCPMCENEAGQS